MERKIEPRDPANYSPVYVEFKDRTVLIMGDSFGRADPYKMVAMGLDQFRALANPELKPDELQNEICTILSRHGVAKLYEAETEILVAVTRSFPAPQVITEDQALEAATFPMMKEARGFARYLLRDLAKKFPNGFILRD